MSFKNIMISTALASFLAAPAIAQETAPATDPATGQAVTDLGAMDIPMTIEEMTVNQFIGLNVLSTNGDDVGEIDYVLGPSAGDDEGQAVIGVGGFLGLGEYTVALPISAFDFDPEGRNLIVNLTEEGLRATPEFDESGAESVEGGLMMADLMGSAGMEDGAATENDPNMGGDTGMEEDATTDSEAATSSDDATGAETDTGSDASTDTEAETNPDTEIIEEGDTDVDSETESNN